MSSLQSNIKSLGAKITECTENEQKALAECKTLQEAVKNENALEFSLRGKENRIEELENEVSSCLILANAFNSSGPIHKYSRLYLKTKIFKNPLKKITLFARTYFKVVFTISYPEC